MPGTKNPHLSLAPFPYLLSSRVGAFDIIAVITRHTGQTDNYQKNKAIDGPGR